MKARLERIDTNSAVAFEALRPEDPARFGVWLNASIGSTESAGADDFQIFVCNSAWLASSRNPHAYPQERYLLVDGPFDASSVKARLESYLETCVGESWSELVAQISKIGAWEFEGYKP